MLFLTPRQFQLEATLALILRCLALLAPQPREAQAILLRILDLKGLDDFFLGRCSLLCLSHHRLRRALHSPVLTACGVDCVATPMSTLGHFPLSFLQA